MVAWMLATVRDNVVQLFQGEGHAALWTFRCTVKKTDFLHTPSVMSEMDTGTVKFCLDSEKLPTLTEKQMDELRKLKDDEIDHSDIPPQTNVKWTRPGALASDVNRSKRHLLHCKGK